MSDALVRLAFAGLAPHSLDKLMVRFGSAKGVARAIEKGKTSHDATIREAVSIDASVRRSQLAELGVAWIAKDDPAYPVRLARFPDAPRWLFVRGDCGDGPSIGIVGTRTCTAYGLGLAAEYGAAAARMGWAVVSGLARGIDTAGHEGARSSDGHCVAVLGSGIDVVYPRSNARLHDSILGSGGAVVSEFPPGTRPDGWRFPTRNRIIVGLSDVILVVEAGATGGALITARIALDYGVPVFAVPGDVDRTASVGTNLLIRDGAFPVLDANDLESTLELVVPFV